jgi:gentisate 1,2-dioxygenase
MDGLDIPMLAFFDAQFAENYPEDVQPVTAREGTSSARYGSNLAPLVPVAPFGKTSPIFSYPYGRSREALAALAKNGDPDACHGWKMQFTNPLSGGPAMPTIGAFIQLLPRGFRSAAYRSTDGTVYSVAEGKGRAKIGGKEFAFEPRDTFVVPSWHPTSIEADDECVLFSYSDRSAQQALGLWREHRG